MLHSSFEEQVSRRIAALTPAERRVAQHLLDTGPEGALSSAAEIAEQLGTSDATVVRTAKALGYGGLADLRRALAAPNASPPLEQRLRQTLAETPPDELLTACITHHRSDVDMLARLVPPLVFQQAVDILSGSARVVWRGVGPSAHVARYAQLLCRRIGQPSLAMVETGASFADELLALQPDDAVVLMAYGRLQSHVSVLLDHLDTLGCPAVLITDDLARTLGTRVASLLQCGRGASGLFSSHAGTLLLVEALVLAVAKGQESRAESTLVTLNELRASLAAPRVDAR
jgi:DNA-binding MurR/RpiR family transcriptional regulator